MIDEGPSPEDLERFSGETGYCPACGEEIWDQAGTCPACQEPIARVDGRPRTESWFRQKQLVLVAIICLIVIFFVFVVL